MNVPPFVVVIGAIFAAFVTGLFNLTRVIVSKEEKVSEYRHHWLSDLRQEIASLLASVETLVRFIEHKFHRDGTEFSYSDLADFRAAHATEYQRLNDMWCKARLRLNPQEHATLNLALSGLIDAFYRWPCNETALAEIKERTNEVAHESERLIKQAWERVKSGERFFGFLRMSLIAGVLILGPLTIGFTWVLTTPQQLDSDPPDSTDAVESRTNAMGTVLESISRLDQRIEGIERRRPLLQASQEIVAALGAIAGAIRAVETHPTIRVQSALPQVEVSVPAGNDYGADLILLRERATALESKLEALREASKREHDSSCLMFCK